MRNPSGTNALPLTGLLHILEVCLTPVCASRSILAFRTSVSCRNGWRLLTTIFSPTPKNPYLIKVWRLFCGGGLRECHPVCPSCPALKRVLSKWQLAHNEPGCPFLRRWSVVLLFHLCENVISQASLFTVTISCCCCCCLVCSCATSRGTDHLLNWPNSIWLPSHKSSNQKLFHYISGCADLFGGCVYASIMLLVVWNQSAPSRARVTNKYPLYCVAVQLFSAEAGGREREAVWIFRKWCLRCTRWELQAY